jgi:replicative DNA helicase
MLTAVPEMEGIALFSVLKGEENIRTAFLKKLREEHFGLYATNMIFKKLLEYMKTCEVGKDFPSIEILKADPSLSEDCRAYLSNGQFGLATNKDDVACALDILENYRQIRVLAVSAEGIASKIKMGDPDIKSIQQDMEKSIMELKTNSEEDLWIHSGLEDNTEKYVMSAMSDKEPPLIKTGFSHFDNEVGGLEKTSELILSTVPGGGKSTMALQIGINMSTAGHSYCLISYEMDEEQCCNRYLANICDLPFNAISRHRLTWAQKQKMQEKWKSHKELLTKMNSRFTIIVPKENFTILDYKSILKPYNYDAVAFDYVSLIPGYDDKQMWERLLLHSKDAKTFAQQTETIVIMLAQMDEDTKNLRYARALRESCNNWWRWDYNDKTRESHILEVEQAKARNSRQFPFTLLENYEYMKIEDVPNQQSDGSYNTESSNNANKSTKQSRTMMGLSDEDDNEK